MAEAAVPTLAAAVGSIRCRGEVGRIKPEIAVRLRNDSAVRITLSGSKLHVERGRGRKVSVSRRRWTTTCSGRNGHQEEEEQERSQPSLADNCRCLQRCFFEICVENMGRPAGTALHEFVGAAVSAFLAGHTRGKLALQLAYGDGGMEEFRLQTEGYRLTASEQRYCSQWLDTIYTTLRFLRVVDNQASRSSPVTADADPLLFSIVARVLEGQISGDEQHFVRFDRGLATKGASGGAIAAKEAIAPQFIPLTQLILLTVKVVNEEI